MDRSRAAGIQVTATAFAALFSVVGLALYGLPLYYDFMVRELGWSVRCSDSRPGGSSIVSARAA